MSFSPTPLSQEFSSTNTGAEGGTGESDSENRSFFFVIWCSLGDSVWTGKTSTGEKISENTLLILFFLTTGETTLTDDISRFLIRF